MRCSMYQNFDFLPNPGDKILAVSNPFRWTVADTAWKILASAGVSIG